MSGLDIIAAIFGIYIWLFHNPIIGIVIYLLPPIISFIRNTKNFWPLTIITILLGWITPVWIVTLVWSIFGELLFAKTDETV